MNTDFEVPSRCSATGVTTAAVLIVVLAMAASTLFTGDASPAGSTAATSSARLVQSHHPRAIGKDS